MKRTVLIILALAMIFCLSGCGEKPFRFHVIAASDSVEDQQLKLKVRDAVISLMEKDMKEAKDADEAKEYIESNLGIIREEAQKTVEENGFDYEVKAETGVFAFPDKTYGDKTYPAGDYSALRITIGEGKGQNWWCVLFPPLCILDLEEAEQMEGEEIEYKSFFVELFEKIFGRR